MLGSPGEVKEILNICKSFKIKLIEDTAWGLGAKYQNKYLGTLGDIGTFSFDYAKTITTGEGGMVIFKNKKTFDKAKAWHDHGHENNPKLPRWRDTRKSEGFNFRISEITAAIGIAQIEKLKMILEYQRVNANYLINKLKKLNMKCFNFRLIPANTIANYDAVILIFKDKKQSVFLKKKLEQNNLSTKILPEAITWHFSYYWKHIKKLKNNNLIISLDILSRSLAIPINCKMKKNILDKYVYIIANSIKNEKIFS